MSPAEIASSVGGLVGLALHLAFVVALTTWGRRIATRRATRAWRLASFMPMAAFLSSTIGLLGTIAGLVHAFGAVAGTEPSMRAQALSEGIRVAMIWTAFGASFALVLYVASVIAFLYGSYGPAPRQS